MSGKTIELRIHVGRGKAGRRELRLGPLPEPAPLQVRVPRIARLMALAIRIDGLVRAGKVRDYAEAARAGRVTRARMSQITALLNLAPDIAEAILFFSATTEGRDPILERDLRPIAAEEDWFVQRSMWDRVASRIRATR